MIPQRYSKVDWSQMASARNPWRHAEPASGRFGGEALAMASSKSALQKGFSTFYMNYWILQTRKWKTPGTGKVFYYYNTTEVVLYYIFASIFSEIASTLQCAMSKRKLQIRRLRRSVQFLNLGLKSSSKPVTGFLLYQLI